MDNVLIFRAEAADKLGGVLLRDGELLDLHCRDAQLVVFNPLNVIDALDRSASVIRRLDTGQIYDIKKAVFHEDRLGDVAAFKIPTLVPSPTYVTQRFVDAWHQAALTGLEFDVA